MYAGRIPDEIIAAVLRQNDIVDVVGKYVHLTKKGRNFVGLCPFHSEKTPSFNVSPEKQIYHCFGCGAGGHVIRFVMNIEGLTFPEAVRSLAEEAGIVWRWGDAALEETPEQRERKAMIAGHELAVKIYHYVLKNTAEGQKAVRYLRGRGFSDKLIDEFEIGYAPRTWDMLARYLAKNGHDPETMETDVPGLFIAGVVAGGFQPNKIFIENGREHGSRIARAASASIFARGAPVG